MKLNDMTIADISAAALNNSYKFEPRWRNCANEAFKEGACWAYNHLLYEGHETKWCSQSAEGDALITDSLLRNNGWKSMPEGDFYLLGGEVNGITVYFEYRLSNPTLFFCDALIPYPISRLSQIKAVFDILHFHMEWRIEA